MSGKLTIAAYLEEQERAELAAAVAEREAARAEAWQEFCDELQRIRWRAVANAFAPRRRRSFIQRLDRFLFG